jgi:hypothetical protein
MAAYAPSGLFGMSGGWFLALKRQALCLCPFGTVGVRWNYDLKYGPSGAANQMSMMGLGFSSALSRWN